MSTVHTLTAVLDCTEEHESTEPHDAYCFDYAMSCPKLTSECEMWISCKDCTAEDKKRMCNAGEDNDQAHGVIHKYFCEHDNYLVQSGLCYGIHGDHEYADYADGLLPITTAGEYRVYMYPDGDGGMDLNFAPSIPAEEGPA